MTHRPFSFDAGAFPGTDILFFLDWPGLGRRLAAALLPPPSLGRCRLMLPEADSATRLFGYARGCGIFPLGPAAFYFAE